MPRSSAALSSDGWSPRRFRLLLTAALIVLVPVGLSTKVYRGPGWQWIRASAGGLLYEVFWLWLVLWLWPKANVWKVALWVFIATSIIEFLQLWQPPWLQAVRGTFLGRTLLGSTFSWGDFPFYALGCLLGAALVLPFCPKKIASQ